MRPSQMFRNGLAGEIPKHLKDAHYKGAEKLGRGIGYKYPHDFDSSWVDQQYLPDSIKNKQYYYPKNSGKFEQSLKQVYDKIRSQKKN